jgi:glycine dehydrogenase subunit 1
MSRGQPREREDGRRREDTTDGRGTPYAPHTDAEVAAMLETIGVDSVEALFDVPETVAFDGEFGIEASDERTVVRDLRRTLRRNDDVVELLGRGHYGGYVPAAVDHLADRAEYLTSYTQYQPEVQQGFLQALFEYQSLLSELAGLEVANCSVYDAATALGEAATMAARVAGSRRIDRGSGDRVLVPEALYEGRRGVLDNYVAGTDLTVDTYEYDDGTVDLDALRAAVSEETVMLYAETPTAHGTVEDELTAVGEVAADHDALFTLGSDPVALSVLEEPATVGADVVVGEADVLGMPSSYGMGMGMFVTREEFVRQVPGRLVGAAEDSAGRRSYTLTLQTREQHIRRERATSNICTNMAWVALRAAMHAFLLGPEGLVDRAREGIERAATVAERLDAVEGVRAPVHDGHHLREFVARVDQPATAVAEDLHDRGFAVHVVGDHRLQVCPAAVTETELDRFVDAVEEVAP